MTYINTIHGKITFSDHHLLKHKKQNAIWLESMVQHFGTISIHISNLVKPSLVLNVRSNKQLSINIYNNQQPTTVSLMFTYFRWLYLFPCSIFILHIHVRYIKGNSNLILQTMISCPSTCFLMKSLFQKPVQNFIIYDMLPLCNPCFCLCYVVIVLYCHFFFIF